MRLILFCLCNFAPALHDRACSVPHFSSQPFTARQPSLFHWELFSSIFQVVGWPPIRAYRMNNLVSQVKGPTAEDEQMVSGNNKSKETTIKNTNSNNKNNGSAQEKGCLPSSLFVKVNMDVVLIGRKVGLTAHNCYESLAETLEDMFHRPTITVNRTSGEKEHWVMFEVQPSKLLDGSSEFVLTYEAKGDWMLVGDVP